MDTPSITQPLHMRCALMQGFSQVYGGTTSIFIGSYSKSSADIGGTLGPLSNAQSGDTHFSGCAVSVSDVAIINSIAMTTGKCDTRFTLRCYCCSFCPEFTVLFVFCDGCRIDLLAQEDPSPTERLYEQCSAA